MSIGTDLVGSWDGSMADFRHEHMKQMADAIDAAIAAEREACAKIARRGSDVQRGWIEPQSIPETDRLLYSALREGQEIEMAIRARNNSHEPRAVA